MPVEWDELRHALRSKDTAGLEFSPEAALERAAKLGDLFAPVLAMKQTLPRMARTAG
jgi:bifunctional non-homologous end joining protein LigD